MCVQVCVWMQAHMCHGTYLENIGWPLVSLVFCCVGGGYLCSPLLTPLRTLLCPSSISPWGRRGCRWAQGTHSASHGAWGFQVKFLCWCVKLFTNWAVSPAPPPLENDSQGLCYSYRMRMKSKNGWKLCRLMLPRVTLGEASI